MTINVRAILGLCVALFGLKVCGINISMEGLGTVTPDLNGRNLVGERIYTITAKPRAGFTFGGWSVWDSYNGVDTEFHSPTLNITLVDGQLYVKRGPNYEFAGSFDASFTAHFPPKNFIPGTYRGFSTETATIYTTLRVSASGAFSGKTFFQGIWHRFSGKFSGAGDGPTTIQIGAEKVGVTFFCDGNGLAVYAETDPYDPDSVLNWLTADLVLQEHDPRISTYYEGKYTMTITGEDNDASVPKGDAFATVSITRAGQLFAAGKLADGTPFTQSVSLSGRSLGEWPIFLLLKGGSETLGGTVTFNTSPGYLAGYVMWEKNPETNGANYPMGFRDYLAVNGSPYLPAKLQGNQILPGTNLVVSFDGGTLPIHFAATGTLNSNNRIVMDDPTNQVTLAINPKNGLFIGDAIPPGQLEPIRFQGVVVQDSATLDPTVGYYGSGFFLQDNLSGRVKIEAPQESEYPSTP